MVTTTNQWMSLSLISTSKTSWQAWMRVMPSMIWPNRRSAKSLRTVFSTNLRASRHPPARVQCSRTLILTKSAHPQARVQCTQRFHFPAMMARRRSHRWKTASTPSAVVIQKERMRRLRSAHLSRLSVRGTTPAMTISAVSFLRMTVMTNAKCPLNKATWK